MDLIVEKSYPAFLIVTVVLGGGAAFLTGRALARSWKSFGRLIFYTLLIAAAVRFLHWGLFLDATYESWRAMQGSLLSVHYYIVDAARPHCRGQPRLPDRTRPANDHAIWLDL